MRSVDHATFWGDGSYMVAVTWWRLHGGSQLHGGSYTVADTPTDSTKVTVLPLPLQWVPRFKSAQDERVFDI